MMFKSFNETRANSFTLILFQDINMQMGGIERQFIEGWIIVSKILDKSGPSLKSSVMGMVRGF
ncbi:MAG: hypothetical protein ACOC44_11020 [Promethearchaeia archaeon]